VDVVDSKKGEVTGKIVGMKEVVAHFNEDNLVAIAA
jgi:hypothetical protein